MRILQTYVRIMLLCGVALVAARSQAAPVASLALVCEDGSVSGKSFDACPASRQLYRTPAATDLVRDCGTDATCWTAGDVYRAFKDVAAGSTYDACLTPLDENTRSPSPWTAAADLCKAWKPKLKAAITVTSGTIHLSWDPVLLCRDSTDGLEKACNDLAHPTWAIRGYRVVSGVGGGPLTLLQSTGPGVTALVLPGYGDGTYNFAVRAFNGDAEHPEGELSPTIQVVVAKDVQPAASGQPSATGTPRATVTYP